jgi:hypothetical protein
MNTKVDELQEKKKQSRESKREEKDEDSKCETIIFLCTNTCK